MLKFSPKRGAIAAGDELTAQAGYEILKAGGNAFDGAMAATLMSFVASSTITSMGGGGFMVCRDSLGKVTYLDFFVQTPENKRKTGEISFFPVNVDFGDKKQEFHVGLGTAATPGNLAGLFEIHQRFGSLPLKDIAAPAIEAARNGVKLHKQTKYQVDILQPILSLPETGKKIYCRENQAKGIGDTYKLPLFADFMEFIALEGPREFYEGEIARKVAEDCMAQGGHLTYSDFSNYRVENRDPLKVRYRDYSIYTTCPPNAGGPLIGFTLSLLNRFALKSTWWGSKYHLDLLVRCIGHTTDIRKEIWEKHLYDKNILDLIFDSNRMIVLKEKLEKLIPKPGNTTHVSIADENLNLVAITTSVGEGCGYYIPGTQIMLNNMLGEEDLNPAGFHQWKPGQRISSMMSPLIMTRGNKPAAALGSGGSNRIRSALVQTIMNYVDFGMDPARCVNTPRIHWENNLLDVEPGYDHEIIDKLNLPENANRFFWTDKNMYFGGAHSIFVNDDGELFPAGDHRRVGATRILI